MKIKERYTVVLLLLLFTKVVVSQNEARNWCFGYGASLNFATTPPSTLAATNMTAYEGCATISGPGGNLLFYTDGMTIWNSSYAVMANGTGLMGNNTPTQSSLILKKPGSTTLYYVFTVQGLGGTAGLNYSIVDMSLAAGQGSVTVKNAPLYNSPLCEKLTATRHCNGVDWWVVVREWTSNTNGTNFRAYQLSSAGVNTVAVVSTYTSNANSVNTSYGIGAMKLSPTGKKLVVANYNYNFSSTITPNSTFELFDFDNSTGIVSNSLALMANPTNTYSYGYGVEFSPDGSKVYGTKYLGINTTLGGIYQWDLCAGSSSAIVASQTLISSNTAANNWYGSMQLAPDGKIYVARWFSSAIQNSLGVINAPNNYGAACTYSDNQQSIAPGLAYYGLPNFPGSYFNQPPPAAPFSYTANNSYGCQTATFNANLPPNMTFTNCASTYSVIGVDWNFGDPGSGTANTTTVINPSHAFTTLGTYTTQLVIHFSCGGGNDTLRQVVIINQPCISVSSTSITCASLGSATVVSNGGVGPYSYTWMPSGQTGSVATGLSPGTYTLTVFDFGNNFTYTASTVFTSLIPLNGTLNNSSGINCNGASTGTANYTGITGGSALQNYLWSNGVNSYTTPFASSLSAGIWSVAVTDALTGCSLTNVFYISQPPALTLNVAATSPTACVNTTIGLSGIAAGGTSGYSYNWTSGPSSDSQVISKSLGGTYVYTLNCSDTLGCLKSNTISVDFINNPTLTVSNTSICPLQTGTISVSGASTYTWSNFTYTATLSDNPTVTTQYTVVGNAVGCTNTAVGSIFIKTPPSIVFSSNSPVCNGQNLSLSTSGGTAYSWVGPLSYTSNASAFTIFNAAPNRSGVYSITLTGANSCTNSSSYSLAVYPTPTVSATGGAICVDQTLNLTSASFVGATFVWSGPNGFTSALQNPSLVAPVVVAASGVYTVKATSAVGCTNTAIANVTVTPLPIVFVSSNSPKCVGDILAFSSANTSGGINFSWSGPNGFTSPAQNPSINNINTTEAGVYSLLVTTGPCAVTKTVGVIVNALPTPTANSNGPVCELKKLLLSTNTPSNNIVSYVWNGPAGFTSNSGFPARDSSALVFSGIYSLMVIDVNACVASTTLAVSVLPNPVLATTSATVCLKDEAVIKVSGANTYNWYGKNGAISSTDKAIISSAINPVGALAVYTVVGTALNSCTTLATASVSTRSLPIPSLKVEPRNRQCLNSRFVFNGYGGLLYSWQGPNHIGFTGSVVPVIASGPEYAGVYTLTVYDEFGCHAGVSTALFLDPLPQGFLSSKTFSACAPFCSDFKFIAAANSSSVVSQNWVLGTRTYTTTTFTPCFNAAGIYTITGSIRDSNLCVNTMTYLVEAYAKPQANFTFSPEHPVENEEVFFYDQSRGNQINVFNWFFDGNEPKASESQNTSNIYESSGNYAVALMIKDARGCADTVVKTVKIEPDFNFYVPNVFTPNGDGRNESFIPVMRGVKQIDFSVFDRWGKRIFDTKDMFSGWDGTYQGRNCPQDVYVWKATVLNLAGEQKEYTGHVTLYR